jgi:GNAT superfamily N-acetyltransferase
VIYLDGVIIGYITISTGEIQKDHIATDKRPFTRTTQIYPTLVIQYFAIDRKYRGKGIGGQVIKYFVGFGRKIANKISCRYLKLYAYNALQFYICNGFQVSEIPPEDEEQPTIYMLYRDLFPECVPLDHKTRAEES